MKQKRVLLIGGNFYPELTGIGKYNGEMIDWLAAQGYECTVITSYPYYPHWKIQQPYPRQPLWFTKEVRTGGEHSAPVHIYRCPHYVPNNPTGAKRMLLDFSFCLSAFLIVLKLLFQKRYSYVICVAPSFQIGLLAILFQKIRGTKFLYHIQDLQIDAARDLKMIKSKAVTGILFKVEKLILKQADVVSSISSGMIEKIKDKCHKDVVLFPNWVNTKLFYPLAEKEKLKEEYGFGASDKIILYSGAIGEKQGLESILYAAKSLQHLSHVKFVICGSGPYQKRLQDLKKYLQVDNVIFMPLQPVEKLNLFLNMADLHLVIQKAKASDLVMPSKLSTIFSIGGAAIVTAPAHSCLYRTIATHNIGILVEPEDQLALTAAIGMAIEESNEIIHRNARNYAKRFLCIDSVLTDFSNHLELPVALPAGKQFGKVLKPEMTT